MIGRRFKSAIASLEFWRREKAAYQTFFRGPYGQKVLADFADFCHAFKTTANPAATEPERMIWMREGRRQVWLFLQHRLELTPQQLSVLYRDIVNDTSGDE